MVKENFEKVVLKARLRRKREQDRRLENFVEMMRAGVVFFMPQLFPIEPLEREGEKEKQRQSVSC